MKVFIVVCATLAIAVAKPQRGATSYTSQPPQHQTRYSPGSDVSAAIVRNDFTNNYDGSYNYQYETANGISGGESGVGGQSVQGSSHYTSPEGIEISLQYTADENGYHPVGDHIPKTPDYILRALEYIRTHPYKIADESGKARYRTKPTATASNTQPLFNRVTASNQPSLFDQQQQQQRNYQQNIF